MRHHHCNIIKIFSPNFVFFVLPVPIVKYDKFLHTSITSALEGGIKQGTLFVLTLDMLKCHYRAGEIIN